MFGNSVIIIHSRCSDHSNAVYSIGALLIKENSGLKYYSYRPGDIENLRHLISAADIIAYFENSDVEHLAGILNANSKKICVQKIAMILFPQEGNYRLNQLSEKLDAKSPGNDNNSDLCNDEKIYREKDTVLSENTETDIDINECSDPAVIEELLMIRSILTKCEQKGRRLDLSFFSDTAKWIDHPEISSFFQMLKHIVLKEYPDRPLRKANEDYFEEEGLFQETDNEPITLSKNWVLDCFQKDGLLAGAMPGYENRDLQVEMAEMVIDGFLKSRNTVIEAGTGTGKSIAYLLPAIWWAKKNQQKVVIATHTIPLQNQLFAKDVPFLQRVLPFSFRGCVLKGKSNYYCMKNYHLDQQKREHFTDDEKIAFLSLYIWLIETKTGDLSELPQKASFRSVWKNIGADSLCEPSRCPNSKHCFMLMARKRAQRADIIIINHSLLFSDIKTDNLIIPEYNYLILDEAHNLYQTAISQLGFELSAKNIDWLLTGISGPGRMSLSSNLVNLLRNEQFEFNNELLEKIQLINQYCLSLHEQATEIFSFFASVMGNKSGIIISEENIGSENFSFFLLGLENFRERFRGLKAELESVNKLLNIDIDNDKISSIKYDIIKGIAEFIEIIKGLDDILYGKDQDRVTYLEKSNGIYLKNSLIDVSSIIKESILDKNNSTVLTSATLSVSGNFSYFTKDIGLTENYSAVVYSSPFDYKENVNFFVVKDLDVSAAPHPQMAERIADFISSAAVVMKGRTLVLFTSYQLMQYVYNRVEGLSYTSGLDILAQGINGGREAVLRSFMENPRSVLMGTSSFWEGIDVPGEKLSCVIIVKLPFMSPSMPLVEARSKKLDEEGRNPFNDFLLPEAVIRFRQGFGRLIRSGTDSGIMILLDDRVLKKYYGRFFLDALPLEQYFTGRSEEILAKISSVAESNNI